MTAIAITREQASEGQPALYRAIAPTEQAQATGRTAGEALDALNAQLAQADSPLVLVQSMRPDCWFTAEQQARLQELMRQSQAAAEAGQPLPPDVEAERNTLIEAELRASGQRAAALADALGR